MALRPPASGAPQRCPRRRLSRTAAPAPRPAAAAASEISSDDELLDRLRKSDVDDYEWSLRRQRLLWRLILPIVPIAVSRDGRVLLDPSRLRTPDGAEHEPNNTPSYANLLAQGPVRGSIGAPINDARATSTTTASPGQRPAHGARASGRHPGRRSGAGAVRHAGAATGEERCRRARVGEWLQPTAIGATEAYVAVREVWIDGTKPTANALDPYTLDGALGTAAT